ncbi:DEAD/DEAH box helicase [Priestia megaterium]|uniref:DEAD/DEAH box helicase n=1 Tax=Priestia megaterium TaxID=1404 RepID=UPI0016498148|nr:DEAD/DEAH box helicase [Priestia megaterium]
MKLLNDLTINTQKNWLYLDASKHPGITKGLFVSMFKNADFLLDKEKQIYQANANTIKKEKLIRLRQRLADRGYNIIDKGGLFIQAERASKNIVDDKKRIKIGREIKANPTFTKLHIPFFVRKLKDFQENVVKHNIAVKHCANFSCPGSGKTTMIYATYAHWKYSQKTVNKLLVICPISAFEAWETEYIGCFGYLPKVIRLNGPNRYYGYKYHDNYELFMINHSTLCNDIDRVINLLKNENFMVVLDESHYVKNFTEGAAWANAVLKISDHAKIRLIASGTPAPNCEKDFWSQYTFLLGGEHILGNRKRYLEELNNDARRRNMMDIVNALSHRVTKEDLGLPPYKINNIVVEMSPIQKKIYDMVAGELCEEVLSMSAKEAQIYMAWRKAKMIRLRQISSNPALLKENVAEFICKGINNNGFSIANYINNYNEYEISTKVKKTIEIALKYIHKGKRVLIWSEFVKNIIDLDSYFATCGIKSFKVYGDIPNESTNDVGDQLSREGQIASFKETDASVLIANPQTMAEAVSLHRECHVAIYLDRSFNCAHWMQSKDRIHRVGLQEDTLTEYYIIENEGSIDRVIDERLNIKEIKMNQILNSEVPVATGEFNGRDFDEEDDFETVLNYIRKTRDVGV